MTVPPQPVTRVFAIVPAAGQSRRMGSAKQLLDWGGRPMLLATLEPLSAASVAGVALVVSRSIVEQLNEIKSAGGPCLQTWVGESENDTFIVYNDDPTSEMIDSIRMGLRAWRERQSIEELDGFLVCPADHPGITTADFDKCIRAFIDLPDRIVVAAYGGRGGHPILLPVALASFVESPACDEGLNAVGRAYPDRVLQVETSSPAVTRDIDTPDDYELLS